MDDSPLSHWLSSTFVSWFWVSEGGGGGYLCNIWHYNELDILWQKMDLFNYYKVYLLLLLYYAIVAWHILTEFGESCK